MVLSNFNEITLALVSMLLDLAITDVCNELVVGWDSGGIFGHASDLIRLVRLQIFVAALRARLRIT